MNSNSNPIAFRYPQSALVRRHAPSGYSDYAAFRPWLRDDFSFRCVYCLIRERWGRISGEFDVDHFVPQVHNPKLSTNYDNLLYSCHSCNLRRGSKDIPDPSVALIAGAIEVQPNGVLKTDSDQATRIIRVLSLNSPQWIQWRRTWIRIINLAEECDPTLFHSLMTYPKDLPDLAKLKPPANAHPEGIEQSYLARHDRGELEGMHIS